MDKEVNVEERRMYISREFSTVTKIVLEDGIWKASVVITEKRQNESGEWEEASVSGVGEAVSDTEAYDTAIQGATKQFAEKLTQSNGKSLFKEE